MADSIKENYFKPYTYDFEDFMGDEDWTKMFVTKLLRTKTGNCYSLPILYKLLVNEMGGEAQLVIAPNHLYIMHRDENGRWFNVELTDKGFPSDEWIIASTGISAEAIRNGIYMRPLTDEESIAFCLYDLTLAYLFQFGYDAFLYEMNETVIQYFPKYINAWMMKSDYAAITYGKTTAPAEKQRLQLMYKEVQEVLQAMGHRDMPEELYEEWVKSMEKEKSKHP